jgi:hypothetical protein
MFLLTIIIVISHISCDEIEDKILVLVNNISPYSNPAETYRFECCEKKIILGIICSHFARQRIYLVLKILLEKAYQVIEK